QGTSCAVVFSAITATTFTWSRRTCRAGWTTSPPPPTDERAHEPPMSRLPRFAFLAFALLFLCAGPLAAQQLQPIDRIVAVVDEDVILQSELDQAMANVLAQ